MSDAIIEKQAEFVAAQAEHQKHIAENYRKLLDSASPKTEERAQPAYQAPAPAPMPAPAPVFTPSADASARIRDYNAYRVPAGQRTLADGNAPAASELVMSVPAAAAQKAAAPATVRAHAEESEDARPTPATMAMLTRDEEAEVEAKHPGFFAALPAKLKVALFVVMSAILVAIAVIFINTSVLRSMDKQLDAENAQIQQLEEQREELRQRFQEVTDPDAIAQWAEEQGWVKN